MGVGTVFEPVLIQRKQSVGIRGEREVGPLTGIIIAFSKIEDARKLKNVLVRSGHSVIAVCSTGAQAISHADGLRDGIVLCGFRLPDMMYSELADNLPEGFELLLMASGHVLEECAGSGCLSVAMPLKVYELIDTVDMMVQTIERRRRKRKSAPQKRSGGEQALIGEAKGLLMERNHMTEEEAHRYIQKSSMDTGTNMAETAEMILSMMR